MKKVKQSAIFCCVLGVVMPIIINLILLADTPNSINIVGDNINWLSFFGSYIGSTVSACSGFIILYFTLRDSQKREKVENARRELKRYEDDLARRFAEYNSSDFINLSVLSFYSQEAIRDEMSRLASARDKYVALRHSAYIVYGREEAFADFYKCYDVLLNKTIGFAEDLIKQHSIQLPKAPNSSLLSSGNCKLWPQESFKLQMMDMSHKYEVLYAENGDVFNIAITCLQDKRNEFETFKNKEL